MAQDVEKSVTLTAPNGVQVSVAESKKDARLAAGYVLPAKAPAKKATASKKPATSGNE